MAQYLVHVHIEGYIADDTEDLVTERMEQNGFSKQCKLGSNSLLLAPWLYGGESTAEESVVTDFLRASLQEKVAGKLHVFVLHAGSMQLACAPSWLLNASVLYPSQH